ncbi:hypothetical protein HYH03_000712 [Edaphochlamys debaryana]|uniref:Uncharacterized protein n=1 Tax=Edaphochlamys debaryana TaxID=47281 RepID=A0A836C6G2_9CHLO|nr:hypothetical protein HYH03_000712 [Edaphochlamys debaryana]|eukprot:KAG2502226.1 hypothetical protein HYH03_000712 [Edaphochlamys debaryana]
MPDKQQLHGFLRAQPDVVSIPFISWVAEQEADAVGEQKRVLAGICEELVTFREQLEEERMDALYADSLAALTDGAAEPREAALALASSPERYANALAERVTGVPVATEGFDPVYDALLKVVPPAALTPEGVRQGHERAKELGEDLRARRKRSVAAMIGRAQLTPEQADKLLAGSNASRILDMLLALPSSEDRVACLPDCFTPPEQPEAPPQPASADEELSTGAAGAGGAGRGTAASMSAPSPVSEAEELVWCTPSQLLVELDSRLQRLTGEGVRPPPGPAPQGLLGTGGPALTGEALLAELRQLREEVRQRWLDTLQGAPEAAVEAGGKAPGV